MAIRYRDFILAKAMEHPGGGQAEQVQCIAGRGRKTRGKARALSQQGFPWGEALVRTLEHHLILEWKLTWVGISSGTAQPTEAKQEGDPMGGDSAPKSRAAKPKRSAKAKAKVAGKRVAKACPDYNNESRGCAKNPKQCLLNRLHTRSRCGLFGHPAIRCKAQKPGNA